jgi:hypothetical protein
LRRYRPLDGGQKVAWKTPMFSGSQGTWRATQSGGSEFHPHQNDIPSANVLQLARSNLIIYKYLTYSILFPLPSMGLSLPLAHPPWYWRCASLPSLRASTLDPCGRWFDPFGSGSSTALTWRGVSAWGNTVDHPGGHGTKPWHSLQRCFGDDPWIDIIKRQALRCDTVIICT